MNLNPRRSGSGLFKAYFKFHKILFPCYFVDFKSRAINHAQLILYRVGWLVGCFGFNGPLRQYFSLYQGRLPKEREKEKRKDRRE